jgi:hypothetical protein
MKKRLEADLISIAHRILQLKNKSDINQLYLETQRLYEKLAVLRFVEDHFGEAKPTIGLVAIEEEIASIFDNSQALQAEITQPEESKNIEAILETPSSIAQEVLVSEEPSVIANITLPVFAEEIVPEKELIKSIDQTPLVALNETETLASNEETSSETQIIANYTFDEIKQFSDNYLDSNPDLDVFSEEIEEETPASIIEKVASDEEKSIVDILIDSDLKITESPVTEAPKKAATVQISFEELLGGNYNDTQFVKVQPAQNSSMVSIVETVVVEILKEEIPEPIAELSPEKAEPKLFTLNEKLAKGMHIDLNDRIAFIKHLFANSEEEYNRVVSQLITYDTFEETQTFIDQMVKPDYNNWKGKEDYEQRFQGIIAKKFV